MQNMQIVFVYKKVDNENEKNITKPKQEYIDR